MKLSHVCIVTDDVDGICEFYQKVLGSEVQRYGEDYGELATEGGTLSFYRTAALDQLVSGACVARQNRSMMIEIEVDDVDQIYSNLQGVISEWVKEPTTQQWGNRSIYFRDPDGHLVNLFTKVDR